MKRVLVLFLMVASGGCGSDATMTDGGTTTMGDIATAPGPDMVTPKPDMSVKPPEGTKLVAGSYFLYGVTEENQAIAIDLNKNNALVAVPVGGNKSTTISPGGWSMSIHGGAVFDWEAVEQQTNVGQGNIWTAAAGLKGFMNGDASIAGIGNISPDGKWLYYSGGAAGDGSTTDLYVAKSDTTGAIKYATGGLVDTTNDPGACTSFGLFSKMNVLLSIVCGQGDSLMGGGKGNLLESVDPATGKTTSLSGNANNWMIPDPTGKWVAAADPDNNMSFFPIAGGMAVAVDKDVKAGQGAWLPDGSAFIYVTNGGQLKRAEAGMSPNATTLVQANVGIIRRFFISRTFYPAMSPDGKWIVISNNYDDQTGIGDIFMASTSTPGMPTTLVPDETGEIFGDAFTQDSAFVIYYTETAQVGSGLIGTLNFKPIMGGGAPIPVAKKVWVSYDGTGGVSGFNDNYKTGKNYGRADLRIVDVSKDPKNIKFVAAQAEAEFFPTPDKKIFVYSTTVSPATSGMYQIPAQP